MPTSGNRVWATFTLPLCYATNLLPLPLNFVSSVSGCSQVGSVAHHYVVEWRGGSLTVDKSRHELIRRHARISTTDAAAAAGHDNSAH